jgi:DMSO/TMAO reductase YedYZ heme-binding membrane subunit
MAPQTWWYLARATGLVAWVLLVASLVWGVLLATRALKPADRPAWLLGVHRALSGGAVVTTALHLVALAADTYVHFGWAELFVPFASPWKRGAVAVGVAAFWLLVAVQATSLAMKRLPKRWWRAVHLTSYAMVWSVTVHAGLAGTDASNRVYQVVALALTIAAVTAALLRVLLGRHATSARRAGDRTPSPLSAPAEREPAQV